MTEKYSMRCLHCKKVFTDKEEAKEHQEQTIFDLAFAHGWRGWEKA